MAATVADMALWPTTNSTLPLTGGSASDWVYEPLRNVYINKSTGQIINGPSPGATFGPSTGSGYQPVERMLYEQVTKVSSELDALRTYLKINHEDILKLFDAAYSTRQRMEIKP